MAMMVPKTEDTARMFANIDSALINMSSGCPCRCTKCNSCACGRCYTLEESIEIDIWD